MPKPVHELWTPCPQVLDEPVTILGLELDDVGLVAFSLVLTSVFCSGIWALAVASAVGWALWKGKRGRPAGDLLHRAHAYELVRLPGVLGPRRRYYGIW